PRLPRSPLFPYTTLFRSLRHRSFRRRIPGVTHQPRASFQSPRFAQPATFMRLPHVEDSRGLDVAIVGVPYDGGTSYRPGARLGPDRKSTRLNSSHECASY